MILSKASALRVLFGAYVKGADVVVRGDVDEAGGGVDGALRFQRQGVWWRGRARGRCSVHVEWDFSEPDYVKRADWGGTEFADREIVGSS